ncbi:MAG TPA: antiviral reverse transcriptase Drt2 [Luteibacter sp.]|jgi:hypothetical protein|uniref:antiviral reverse transcriptase Drt2 n=1 Tax=Luteibacter sp. TaxID=1886636 RepID=UPI002F3F3474
MATDPLRPRSYLHLDERTPREVLLKLVSNPATVAKWQFLPLLVASVLTKKVRRNATGLQVKEKSRPICYASHRDAGLYAYYSEKLTKRYEALLAARGLSDCVTAFRSGDGRCNIHFALDAFNWIEEHRPCTALAYDISSFFDALDHKLLKKKWSEVLGCTELPSDHYSLFRALTRQAKVEQVVLYALFGISRHAPKASGRKRICSPEQFRKLVVDAGHLKLNVGTKGIPQGTPISATLSNIYMLDFDERVAAQMQAWGGFYRRYCDDVLCAVPPHRAADAKVFIESLVKEIKLEVQEEKLEICAFGPTGTAIQKPLQYLGLTFNGLKILLRSGGVGRFYSRLRKGVRMADRARAKAAMNAGVPKLDVPIKRGKLNRSYTFTGHQNFVTYAHRAAKITNSPAIAGQVARRWSALDRAIRARNKT